jgi:aspartyl-tRNA(Asn)/glutamyl-tRNA(Gln) amidotransferase subunit B
MGKEMYFTYVIDADARDITVFLKDPKFRQTSDTGAIDAEIDKVLAANVDKVAEYKAGKQQLFGFFVGQTMKAMQGKGNPKLVNERLRAKLTE